MSFVGNMFKLLLLASGTLLGSCAKPHVSLESVEPQPAFEVRVGELRAFADYRSICVQAFEQETQVNLTTVAVSNVPPNRDDERVYR
jgi:hypothetical protein